MSSNLLFIPPTTHSPIKTTQGLRRNHACHLSEGTMHVTSQKEPCMSPLRRNHACHLEGTHCHMKQTVPTQSTSHPPCRQPC